MKKAAVVLGCVVMLVVVVFGALLAIASTQPVFDLGGDVAGYVMWGAAGRPATVASPAERQELRGYGKLALASRGIWAMNADGSGRRRLAPAPAVPPVCWSPDGRWLAFSDGRDIHIVEARGRWRARLTRTSGRNLEPAWSPDGREIAFSSSRHGDFDLYVMRADGSHVRRLTRSSAAERVPAWSPDGTTLAFEAVLDGPRVELVNADGTGRRPLARTATAFDPAWSPDGERLAFVGRSQYRRYQQVFVADVESSDLRALSEDALYDGARHPVWSPDGKRLALTSGGAVYVDDAEGGDSDLVAGGGCFAPVWSPDGRKLAFLYGSKARLSLFAWPYERVSYSDSRYLARLPRSVRPDRGDALTWEPLR